MKIRDSQINDYVKEIRKRFHPQKIILFGSYASGEINRASDVDLLVIMDTKLRPVDQAVRIRKELPAPFPLDLIVRRPKEIKERIEKDDYFLKAVLSKGKKL